jgi:hypothetical protein
MLATCLTLCPALAAAAQEPPRFTHADTLRGSNTAGRAWWDATFYDLHVRVNPGDSTIRGWNSITYRVVSRPQEMQIDLQMPLVIDSVIENGRQLAVRRDSNAFFVRAGTRLKTGDAGTVMVYYHGRPKVATNPPWVGGYQWTVDSLGNRWFNTSNEGLGASVWWPNKDYLADEPDSQRIAITVPDSLQDVSNGRLRAVTHHADHTATYEWFVTNPINNYDVAVNAGAYAHFGDLFHGENGPLTLDFYPIAYHADTARVQFKQAESMMACFENWFGPYPWYEDGYKLVETSHLGMEHQSGIAYGNRYKNGYLGRDLSGTGIGLKWDYIIVHESAHEWWGNNITVKDGADMWVHEGFAYYAEGIYTECTQSKEAGARYLIGSRRGIRNTSQIIGVYGVNNEGSGDRYSKGANMLHTIRQLVNDDAKWREILRGLNRTFWHQTVTTQQIEAYISREAGQDFSKVFDQYLRSIKIPTFEYKLADSTLDFHWTNVVPGFAMPVRVTTADSLWTLVRPAEAWSSTKVRLSSPAAFRVDENFYVMVKGPKDSVAVAPTPAVPPTQQPPAPWRQTDTDEYTRYELLDPASHSFHIIYDVTATTPGARVYFNGLRAGSEHTMHGVIDLMTGAQLQWTVVDGATARATGWANANPTEQYLQVTLPRPVPPGGQVRLRIDKTYRDTASYSTNGQVITFNRSLGIKRNSVVLPAGYEVVEVNYPSQIVTEADGRIKLSFINPGPASIPYRVRARPLSNPLRTTAASSPSLASPTSLTSPTSAPSDAARPNFTFSERAFQDRDIVYFLKQPETHSFHLYHDYTESRPGVDRYVNVVRPGSTVSEPSAVLLDTGERLKVESLKGDEIRRRGIDAEGPITPQTEVAVAWFPAVRAGQSVRLRIEETYTDPGRYVLSGDELVWDRSFGRPRNAVVLPDGWYVTANAIPAVVSLTEQGQVRLDYVNDRPDEIRVFIKARRR